MNHDKECNEGRRKTRARARLGIRPRRELYFLQSRQERGDVLLQSREGRVSTFNPHRRSQCQATRLDSIFALTLRRTCERENMNMCMCDRV